MSSELVCNFCGKQFSSETLLNDHNRDVHTKIESPCNLCDKSFRSKTKLRYHITSTHAEKEAFQCDIKSVGIQCTYNSSTNSTLRAHNKRVHEEKPTNGNESIWDKARLSNKWQKDDDPKCREETAEYDVAPQQVSLEINLLIFMICTTIDFAS